MTAAVAQRGDEWVHDLKTWPVYFTALAEGRKTYELRRDDRGFEVGDVLRLREWDPRLDDDGLGGYTGREVRRVVTHVLRDAPGLGLTDGFALLSLADRRSADTEALRARIEGALTERSVAAFRNGQDYIRVDLVRAALDTR